MTEPESLRVEASGMTFGALAWGDPDAPLALMVHGYPDTAWTWRHLGPDLAGRGWRAVAPFSRGYAPTDLAPDGSYLIADLAGDALALRDALGGDRRSVLIGHDWGAVATWDVAGRDPSRFAHYVALAVPPAPALVDVFSSTRTFRIGLRQLRMSWYMLYNQLPGAERGLDRVIPRLWHDWSPGYDADADLAHVFEALAGPGRRRAALRYYRDNLRRGLRAGATGVPRAPALYLHGELDGCLQAVIGEAYAAKLPQGSRFELVGGAGHFLQLEDPRRVNALIEGWIGSPQ